MRRYCKTEADLNLNFDHSKPDFFSSVQEQVSTAALTRLVDRSIYISFLRSKSDRTREILRYR